MLETKTQRKLVDPYCHCHSNAHKPHKTSALHTFQRIFFSKSNGCK